MGAKRAKARGKEGKSGGSSRKGVMAEWSNAAVLKTAMYNLHRGFESHLHLKRGGPGTTLPKKTQD
jgi:hypothetical protein